MFKLEDCLSLRKNSLVGLLVNDIKKSKKEKNKFVLNKFDFINTWKGTLLYFLLLITIIFVLKRYFYSNVSIIEIQKTEEEVNEKK